MEKKISILIITFKWNNKNSYFQMLQKKWPLEKVLTFIEFFSTSLNFTDSKYILLARFVLFVRLEFPLFQWNCFHLLEFFFFRFLFYFCSQNIEYKTQIYHFVMIIEWVKCFSLILCWKLKNKCFSNKLYIVIFLIKGSHTTLYFPKLKQNFRFSFNSFFLVLFIGIFLYWRGTAWLCTWNSS